MTFGIITRGFGAVALMGTLTFTAACNRNEPASDVNTAATQPANDQSATQPSKDARIGTSLQAKYYADDRIRGHRIDVDAQNGVVTLRGTVPDNAAKEHAVTLARDVEGVTDVKDELQVKAAESTTAAGGQDQTAATGTSGRDMDERQPGWITTKVQAQYFVNPEIKPWNIDVTTSGSGVVTLEGEVDSAEDKAEAVRIASQTDGVTRVEDRLRVDANAGRDTAPASETEPKAEAGRTPARETGTVGIERPDAWLTAKIQAKYFIDTDVKGRRIDVDTQNGVVTLTGSVGSEAERRHAAALARNTDGVREVKDQLRIDAALRDREAGERQAPGRQGQVGTTQIERPDAWITTKVQAQYFLDDEVKGHEINVDTNNGVVTLKGTVDTAQQKQEAEQIARETEGVRRVENQLTVGATGGPTR
jgi:osmotically-inducible protein OsmY